MTNHKAYNLIILDESGSMESIKTPTIRGFNEVVQTIREVEKQFPEQEHYVTLITFNGGGIKTLLDKQRVNQLFEIDQNRYQPNASTPLLDAIGFGAIGLKNYLQDKTDYNVLVTILTDGEENASREFNRRQINEIINELKTKGWVFTYIGANQDVDAVADSLSINSKMAFMANEADMRNMFDKERKQRMAYYKNIHFNREQPEDYFEDQDEKKS
ncbi:MAG: VWA domain-containing protein [Sphingobacteriales bacterium]|nr:MAG: VWA domain-containing protein [Sphingobacteriales bacterium]